MRFGWIHEQVIKIKFISRQLQVVPLIGQKILWSISRRMDMSANAANRVLPLKDQA
jgi:hypothetical protein